MPSRTPVPRPWHLWPVGLAALAVHGAAALHYLAVRLGLVGLLAGLPAGHAGWLAAQPLWVGIAWAVAVWGGLVGAILLLTREDGAAIAFALAFIGLGAAAVHLTLFATPPAAEVLGPDGDAWLGGAAAAVFLFWLYARAQKVAGVLS